MRSIGNDTTPTGNGTEIRDSPLLARGRDRLETFGGRLGRFLLGFLSYSLGDAIDWKLKFGECFGGFDKRVSYSLGDAIDWKH